MVLYRVTSFYLTPMKHLSLTEDEKNFWEKNGLPIHWISLRGKDDWGDKTSEIQRFKRIYRAKEFCDNFDKFGDDGYGAPAYHNLLTYSECGIDECLTLEEASIVSSYLNEYSNMRAYVHPIELCDSPTTDIMCYGGFGSCDVYGFLKENKSDIGWDRFDVWGWYNADWFLSRFAKDTESTNQ